MKVQKLFSIAHCPSVKTLFMGSTLLFAVACNDNVTSSALCTKDNQTDLPGVSGRYTYSIQGDDFEVDTQFVDVAVENGTLSTTASEDQSAGSLCSINNRTYVEYQEDGVYRQYQIVADGRSITLMPLAFDRSSLTEAGISTEIIVSEDSPFTRRVKTALSSKMARFLDDEESSTKMLIHAEGHSAADLMKHASTGVLGFTYVRE
jgi:hypothetical protein